MHSDIIIVGAGVSGLSAALMILDRAEEHGEALPAITILEAAGAPGGRMAGMDSMPGVTADLGGTWFQGGKHNNFYQWLKKRYDLGAVDSDDGVQNERAPSIMAAPSHLTPAFLGSGWNALSDAWKDFTRLNPRQDPNLAQFAASTGRADCEAVAAYASRLWMGLDGADQVSSREFLEDPYGPGGLILRNGMGWLARTMERELVTRSAAIHYNCPVAALYEEDDHVVATDTLGRIWKAGRALVTASAGALKSRVIAFEDSVQETLDQTLDGVVMGHVTKIILSLSDDFFEARDIHDNTDIYMARSNALPHFIHARTGGRPTLTIFTGGEAAVKLEQASPAELDMVITRALAPFPLLVGWGDELCAAPVVTSWNGNPYTGGAYSAIKPGAAHPEPFWHGRIGFAGEAFAAAAADGPTTLLGAWSSARQITAGLFAAGFSYAQARVGASAVM